MKPRKQTRVQKDKAERRTAGTAQPESESVDPAHTVERGVRDDLTGAGFGMIASCEDLAEPRNQTALNALFRQVWFKGGQPESYSWEDLRQDTLVRFWSWLPRYRGEAKPLTVLYRMAVNQMITEYRYRRAQIRDDSKLDAFDEAERVNAPGGESHEESCNNGLMIERCREALSGKNLEIFEGVLAGETYEQISADLGISRQAVAMRWSRIKKVLRHVLENGGAASPAEPVKVPLPGGATTSAADEAAEPHLKTGGK